MENLSSLTKLNLYGTEVGNKMVHEFVQFSVNIGNGNFDLRLMLKPISTLVVSTYLHESIKEAYTTDGG